MTHTPGPWSIQWPKHQADEYITILARPGDSEGDAIGFLARGWDDEQKANALLIAASPELLKALKALVQESLNLTGHKPPRYLNQLIKAADRAITKAEGE